MTALPFQLAITSRSGAKKAVKRFGATHVLSTLDPGVRLFKSPRIAAADHMELWFEDEEDPGKLYAPTRDHVEAILRWGERLRPEHFAVIHCEAGQCRSTAAALLLLVQQGGRERAQEMMDHVVSIRPQACPNMLMMLHGADLLGCPELMPIANAAGRKWIERLLRGG